MRFWCRKRLEMWEKAKNVEAFKVQLSFGKLLQLLTLNVLVW